MSYPLRCFLACLWLLGLIVATFALDVMPWWGVAAWIAATCLTLQFIKQIDVWASPRINE